MDLSKVSKVEVLTNHVMVNAYLDLGWEILNSYASSHPSLSPNCVSQVFVMVWGEGEPKYPEARSTDLDDLF